VANNKNPMPMLGDDELFAFFERNKHMLKGEDNRYKRDAKKREKAGV
jgi:hypothetical protein